MTVSCGSCRRVSGHLANWKIGLPVAAALGLSVAWFYRPASNPVSNRVLQALRREAMGAVETVNRGVSPHEPTRSLTY
jgi:lauroyl/myristoyl acyltransferase